MKIIPPAWACRAAPQLLDADVLAVLRREVLSGRGRHYALVAENNHEVGILARTVRTGTFCSYAPDPRAPIEWETGAYQGADSSRHLPSTSCASVPSTRTLPRYAEMG